MVWAEASDQGERQIPVADADQWTVGRGQVIPRGTDVLVIGGGIIGCVAAYELARRGASVVLCEKGRVAGEQSGRNWGWVRQQGRSPIELPLMMQSLRRWQALTSEIGDDIGFTQGGCLYLAEDNAQLAGYERWLATARAHELDTRLLRAEELQSLLRTTSRRWAGALYTASDGRAEPSRAAPAIARAAARAGATVLSRCAVRGIETQAGAVHSVLTEHGAIRARRVLCAGGAWTRLFCGSLGIDVPQLSVQGTVARLAPGPKILDGCAYSTRIALRRRVDGGYTVAHGNRFVHQLVPASIHQIRRFWPALRQETGAVRLRIGSEFWRSLITPRRWPLDACSPFEQCRVLEAVPDRLELHYLQREVAAAYPELIATPLAESWGGVIETSPDVLPIISAVDSPRGFYVATGFSGHGFGIGPGAGLLAADMLDGRASSEDLQRFRLSRFFDGTPIVPGPTI